MRAIIEVPRLLTGEDRPSEAEEGLRGEEFDRLEVGTGGGGDGLDPCRLLGGQVVPVLWIIQVYYKNCSPVRDSVEPWGFITASSVRLSAREREEF